jgi:hypothetical protein
LPGGATSQLLITPQQRAERQLPAGNSRSSEGSGQ